MYHAVDWTPARIEGFWNFYSQNAAAHASYFSGRFGGAVLRLVRRRVNLDDPVLDLGCGRGHLVEEVLWQGLPCQAVDSSAEAVDRV